MSAFKKGRASITPDTDTPTLTVVAVKSTMCGGSPDKHEGGIACNSLDGDRGALCCRRHHLSLTLSQAAKNQV